MPTVATIGVYGFTLERFLDALRAADVRQLLDVRQRRGVRGPQYAWANAARLQAALAEAGHRVPPPQGACADHRAAQLQYREDERLGVGKRSRVVAGARVCRALHARDPRPADLGALVAELPAAGAAALFCVEADPEACHRSLIAQRLADRYGMRVARIRP